MQGLLLSLAKASKRKELAYVKLIAGVRAIQRKLSLLTLCRHTELGGGVTSAQNIFISLRK